MERHDTLPGPARTEQLRQTLSDHFAGATVLLDGPISVRDNSRIFHAVIHGEETIEAAVKQCSDLPNKLLDEAETQRQYVALKRVSEALARSGGNRHRVPAPLAHLPEQAAYAMSWIDGISLTRKMRRISAFIDGERWFAEVGAWLALFHRAGPCREQITDLAQPLRVVRYLDETPLPEASFHRALHTLRATARVLHGVPVTVSWLHGDCKMDNFMLSGNLLYGIDISLNHENAVEYDIAQFLNNLMLSLAHPPQMQLLLIRSRLESAFWKGYVDSGPPVSQLYLNWLRLAFCVAFWHKMSNRQASSIRRKVLNVVFSLLTTRLVRDTIAAVEEKTSDDNPDGTPENTSRSS